METSKKFILIILIFVNFLRSIGGTSISIGLPDFIADLAGSATAYGLVLGIFSIVQTTLQTPTAFLSDWYGRKKMILLGMTIYLIGTVACAFAITITQLIIFRAIQGAGAYSSVLLSVISDKFTKEERSRALSYYMISLTGGYMVGNIIGGFLVPVVGLKGIFFVSAGLIAFAFLFVLFFLPETYPKKEENYPKKRDWGFIKNIEFIFGIFMNIVKSFCISGILAYQIWLFTQDFNLSELNTSLLLIPLAFFYLFGILSAPKFSKKLGILRLIQYSSIAFVISGILVLVKFELYWYLIFSFVGSFSMGLLEPEITAFVQGYISESGRGLGNGIFNTFGFLFGGIGQIILPLISDKLGFNGVYGFLIGIWSLMVVLLVFIRKKYD